MLIRVAGSPPGFCNQIFNMQPLNFLSKHRVFVGNVATMMSGKTVAAGIALVTTPIVARLFAPSDFGVAAAFLAIVGMISNVG